MKILIAVPCMDQVPAVFAQSLAALEKVEECWIQFRIGSLIYDARNELAKEALRMGTDYVFWMDSDMTFTQDALKRLVKRAKEYGENTIMTGLYFRRVEPFSPVLLDTLDIGDDGRVHFENTKRLPKEPFEVAGCGFGCVLLPTQALMDVAARFGDMFGPMKGVGEDLSFCIRARECGYRIICDPAIECGHVGHNIITRGFWESYKHVKGKAGK